MVRIVGVKFNHTCKVYFFSPNGINFNKGDGVIVETVRGVEYGKVVVEPKDVDESQIVPPLKPVIRKATEKDEKRIIENESKIKNIVECAQKEVEKCGLEMKIVDAEYPFDNSKIIIYFTAPNRIDFRELVKNLATVLKQRIDLRQIGTRDETKLLGGIASCGRVCCCKSFLPDFKKVTIKMAKNQGLSLNPTKISGLCGRLMCCLEYENEPYAEAYKKMPKIGTEIMTPDGKAIAISNNMLKMLVKTKSILKDGSIKYGEYKLEEIKFKQRDKDNETETDDSETDIIE